MVTLDDIERLKTKADRLLSRAHGAARAKRPEKRGVAPEAERIRARKVAAQVGDAGPRVAVLGKIRQGRKTLWEVRYQVLPMHTEDFGAYGLFEPLEAFPVVRPKIDASKSPQREFYDTMRVIQRDYRKIGGRSVIFKRLTKSNAGLNDARATLILSDKINATNNQPLQKLLDRARAAGHLLMTRIRASRRRK